MTLEGSCLWDSPPRDARSDQVARRGQSGRARRDDPTERKPPSLPMLSTLWLLPMLRIDAKLPMLKSDAALAIDNTLDALSTLHTLR
jgi:hypothetical protein